MCVCLLNDTARLGVNTGSWVSLGEKILDITKVRDPPKPNSTQQNFIIKYLISGERWELGIRKKDI